MTPAHPAALADAAFGSAAEWHTAWQTPVLPMPSVAPKPRYTRIGLIFRKTVHITRL